MGYIKHHAITVTSWDNKQLEIAHNKARDIFGRRRVSELLRSDSNGYDSFFIAPDGSKEGWEHSNIGDSQRESFIKWLDTRAYEDGSNALSYCEFFYGEDNGFAQVVNHN